jgi:hypothetical protein
MILRDPVAREPVGVQPSYALIPRRRRFDADTSFLGALPMSIRVLAFALLIAASAAIAAPPKNPPPKSPPTGDTQTDNVDVDAMARAKDVGGNEAAAGDAAASNAPATAEAPAPETTTSAESAAPSVDAAPGQAATSATETAPAAPAQRSPAAASAIPSAEEQTEKSIAASCVSRTTSLLDDAEKADYGNATRDFDAKMRTALPVPKFKEAWESLAQFGKLVARGQSHLGTGDGYTLVMVPLVFEKANLVAQVACGSDGRIAGFHVTRAPKPQF